MSYAIVRNEKLVRAKAQGICVHNDRRAKNHSNKEIDVSKTCMNYYLKKNELNYVKEFDRLKGKYAYKGQIRSNSIIICEMIFTSDDAFFSKIGFEETKRYFEESYKFICNYNNLGEENIISAVVHLDESTPHMHLIYVPIVHIKDENGTDINKVCCRDFWKGRDSYRKLQNSYYEYITSKGFKLERGLPVEETNRKHENIQEFKQITNFENTKKLLQNMKLELPKVPELKDIRKVMIGRDEKILNEIIKPKDELIEKLYQDNIALHTELSKQTNIIDEAEEYQKERDSIITNNNELNAKVKHMEHESEKKSNTLVLMFNNRKQDLEEEYEIKFANMENKYKKKINVLEKEISHLYKVVDKFKDNIFRFLNWICKKFAISEEESLIRDFQKETNSFLDAEKQLAYEKKQKEKEWDLEL